MPIHTTHTSSADIQEAILDGVRCVELLHQGQPWRLGSCSPTWRTALPILGENPSAEAMAALATQGIWLAPTSATAPLALICCGQGAVWPHMGRELYDRIPAARAAMDRIAAIASWDVLSLLDENSVEIIGQTRWQQPYLFLLQYAQWSYFSSLGLAPCLMAGHSLGEMIALCFAGAYSPETAWNMIDTRARHTADIEASSTRESGMMAVHANEDTVRALLQEFPDLYVSNFNAPTQVILSGPRDMLTSARKLLRKQRIPAMLLNVTVAFHNPGMRVLHNTAIQRLRVMEMRQEGPVLPVMSNTTAELYPSSREAVCQYISVLDENSVRWVECVRTMWRQHGIRHFLETGPQDTLCGLVGAIEAEALCIPAVKKGRELEGLRQAVARLYALGHIPRSVPRTLSAAECTDTTPDSAATQVIARHNATEPDSQPLPQLDPEFSTAVMAQIASTLQRDSATVRPEHDLRYDLGLRSSLFPLLLQDLEQCFGITIRFEDLLHVLTVEDLIYALNGILHPEQAHPHNHGVRHTPDILPIRRWRIEERNNQLQATPAVLQADNSALPLQKGACILVVSHTPLATELFTGLAALGCTFVFMTPETLPEADAAVTRDVLQQLGARVEYAVCTDASLNSCTVSSKALSDLGLQPDGLICLWSKEDDAMCSRAIMQAFSFRWAAILANRPQDIHLPVLCHALQDCAAATPLPTRRIILSTEEEMQAGHLLRSQYAGDMLLRELLHGEEACILWARQPLPMEDAAIPLNASSAVSEVMYSGLSVHNKDTAATVPLHFLPARSEAMRTGLRVQTTRWPLVWPDAPSAGHVGPQPFAGTCHFSSYAPEWTESIENDSIPASPAYTLEAMLEAASQHLPWLTPTGMADIRWTAPLQTRPGITRECALTASTSVWFRPDGHLSRFCPVRMQVRAISENGRRQNNFTDICSSFVLLSPHPRTVPPFWPTAMQEEREKAVWQEASGVLRRWRRHGEGWMADIHPQQYATTPSLLFPVHTLHGVLQLISLALKDIAHKDALHMRLAGIGFIYFSSILPEDALTIELRRTFLDADRVQFDVQAHTTDGAVVFTCNTVEYLRHSLLDDVPNNERSHYA